MAADISTMGRQVCPRNRIQPAIATVMLAAMVRAITSVRSVTAVQPRASKASASSGPRTTMPSNIATTISR